MPKVSSSPGMTSSRPSLRRNQACLSCRKRKLKCDAARPHCGTCVKQWQATVSVPPPPGYAHPSEPQCSYDPVEGLPLAPDIDPLEKIKDLEEQITHLRKKLKSARRSSSPPPNNRTTSSPAHRSPPHGHHGSFSSASPPMPFASRTSAFSTEPDRNGATSSGNPSGIVLPRASLDMLSPDRSAHSESPELISTGHLRNNRRSDALDGLLYSGWNPDLPDPTVLEHCVEAFFRCDPCGSRVLHRPSLMASLRLPPKSPGFPHSAILHAICASASRWASSDIMTLPDGTRRDRFAEFHAGKTRQYIDRTMASGDDIFPVMQACVLLSWYFYSEGRWVEVWIFAGFQTRVAVPLRLNYPGTFASHNSNSPGAYLAPPRDQQELELRRRTWWMTILFDRIVSVGGWVHGVDERDIGTELPLRCADFEAGNIVPSNQQSLMSESVFTDHPPLYTDSFLLLIKATMLFGRVTDFGVRTSLRAPMTRTKGQDPLGLAGFEELDSLVCVDFLASLPQQWKNSFGCLDGIYGADGTGGVGAGGLDTDLYMVHLVPHAAAITLHNPYLDFTDPQSLSTTRCLNAARAILTQHYTLTATSFDITRLHPFATICWYLAAVVQIQLCKYFIEIGNTEREYGVWGEINVLRFAMTEYGKRSPIGTRQEKLLQGLMAEIVRMTTQQQPLEVGIPLYPFSHAGVFEKSASGSGGPGGHGGGDGALSLSHVAPLPVDPEYESAVAREEQQQQQHGHGRGGPQLGGGHLGHGQGQAADAWVLEELGQVQQVQVQVHDEVLYGRSGPYGHGHGHGHGQRIGHGMR